MRRWVAIMGCMLMLAGCAAFWDANQADILFHGNVYADMVTSIDQAESRGNALKCAGTHTHDVAGATVYMPCNTMDGYKSQLETRGSGLAGSAGGEAASLDPLASLYATEAEALARAEALGCEGSHTVPIGENTLYVPCADLETYIARVEAAP